MGKKKTKKTKTAKSINQPIAPSTVSRLKKIENQITSLFTIFSRLFLLVIALTAAYLIYKSLRNDSYVIQPFQVPTQLEASGYNGAVFARKLQDRVAEVKTNIGSTKTDSIQFQANEKPDLKVDVVGFGLSLNSLTYHLKSLLGREINMIAGELTDMNGQLSLTMRMTGYESKTIQKNYLGAQHKTLDSLLEEGAKYIIKNTDPYRIAVYHYNHKEYSKSLQIIHQMIKKEQELPWAYLAWGNLLNKQGKQGEAIEKFEKALTIDPAFDKVLSNIAWTHFRNKDYEKAIPAFKRNLAINPEQLSSWNGIAMSYRALDQDEAALAAYDKLITADPTNLWGYTNKADFLLSKKDTVGASALFQLAAEKVEEGVDKYFALGGFYVALNKLDSTLIYGEKILEIEPNNSRVINQIILCSYYMERYETALTYRAKAEHIDENGNGDQPYHKVHSLNMLAMASYQLKRYEDALELVNQAIAVDPSIAYPYTTLAETYGLMGQTDNFYAALLQALEKGFPLEELLEDEPYVRFIPQTRFQKIIEKYKTKKEEMKLAQAVKD